MNNEQELLSEIFNFYMDTTSPIFSSAVDGWTHANAVRAIAAEFGLTVAEADKAVTDAIAYQIEVRNP